MAAVATAHTVSYWGKIGVLTPQTMGGGAVRPSLPCFLPFTQNYLEVPIPENS